MKLPAIIFIAFVLLYDPSISQNKYTPIDSGLDNELLLNVYPSQMMRQFWWNDEFPSGIHEMEDVFGFGVAYKYKIPSTYKTNRMHHLRFGIDYQRFVHMYASSEEYLRPFIYTDPLNYYRQLNRMLEFRAGYQYTFTSRRVRPFVAMDLFYHFRDVSIIEHEGPLYIDNSKSHLIGINPIVGLKYQPTKRLSLSMELVGYGSITYMKDADFTAYVDFIPAHRSSDRSIYDVKDVNRIQLRSVAIGYSF